MGTDSPFEPTVLGAMWRYRWLVALIVLLVTAAVVVNRLSRRVLYDASGTGGVQTPATGAGARASRARLADVIVGRRA